MLFNWKLKILSSVVAVAMFFTVCPSTTFAAKTWLHELLEDEKHAPSIEEVERIVKKHPEWLNEEDKDGRTPVKIAGDKGLSEIKSFLSDFVPPSSGPDYAKKMATIFTKPTWLHEVLEDEDVPFDEFKHIVDKHPEWLSKKDDKGRTPFKIAEKKHLHDGILHLLNEPELLPSAFSKEIAVLKTQTEKLQQRNKSLETEIAELRDQLAALTAKVGVITGGTIDSTAITGGTISGASWSDWKSDSEYFKIWGVSTDGVTHTNNFLLTANTLTAIPFFDISPLSNDLASLTWASTGSKITIKSGGTYMLFYNMALYYGTSDVMSVLCRTNNIGGQYLYSYQIKPTMNNIINYYTGFDVLKFDSNAQVYFYVQTSKGPTNVYGGGDVYSELYFLKIG